MSEEVSNTASWDEAMAERAGLKAATDDPAISDDARGAEQCYKDIRYLTEDCGIPRHEAFWLLLLVINKKLAIWGKPLIPMPDIWRHI